MLYAIIVIYNIDMLFVLALSAFGFCFQESLGAQKAHNEWGGAQRDAYPKWSEHFVNSVRRHKGAAHSYFFRYYRGLNSKEF